MWQSQLEIEYYSIAHFEHIITFNMLWFWASAKGGACTHFIDTLTHHKHMSPTHSGSLVPWCIDSVRHSKYTTELYMFPDCHMIP